MPDVIARYTPHTPRMRRIPCPLHNGRDYNFSFTDTQFKCFVCDEGGDVISFVEKLFGVDYKTAVQKLNDDFHLGLLKTDISPEDLAKAKAAYEERRIKREIAELRLAEATKAYDTALAFYARCDLWAHQYEPTDDHYAYAVQNIDKAAYFLEQAEERLNNERRADKIQLGS